MELTANPLFFPISKHPFPHSFKRSNLFNQNPNFPNPNSISSNPKFPIKPPIFIPFCTNPTNTDDIDHVTNPQDPTFSRNSPPNLQNPQAPTSNLPKPTSNPSFSRGLVLDLGPKGSWDSLEVGSPVVKRFLSDEKERWFMWYFGRSESGPDPGSIGLVVSSNGVHWERGKGVVQSSGDVGLVLKSSQDWWAFDTHGVRPGGIVVMSSSKVKASSVVYWLYYTGFCGEKIESSDNSLGFRVENPQVLGVRPNGVDENLEFRVENPEILGVRTDGVENHENLGVRANGVDEIGNIYRSFPGLAMSQDGRYWARIEGEHHNGSLFGLGAENEWDSTFIASPQVVFHGSGDLRMYYHSFDAEKGSFGIGIARSRDGLRWVKLGKIMGGGRIDGFDEYGAMNPCILRNKRDGGYLMAYEGVSVDGERSIGLAQSTDGLKDWRRVGDEPILKRADEEGCWDDRGVGSPCLVPMEGEEDEWRLYYRGIGACGRTGIGMAVSGGKGATDFRRWTGFHM